MRYRDFGDGEVVEAAQRRMKKAKKKKKKDLLNGNVMRYQVSTHIGTCFLLNRIERNKM